MSLVRSEITDGVAVVTLDDAERRNAMTLPMVAEVVEAMDGIEADGSVGAVVVTGAGKGFCAGADLSHLEGQPDRVGEVYEGFLRIARCPLPTIAAVNGAAVGAGMNLALCCDVRIASTRARFITRFLELGLHPGGGHTWMLRRAVGEQQAMAMVALGQSLDGEEAARRGLVWACVEPDDLLPTAVALGRNAAEAPRELVVRVKESIRHMADVSEHDEAVAYELEPQVWTLRQPWFEERLAAIRSRMAARD